jgi:ribose-phosphate pyrophosphokinase
MQNFFGRGSIKLITGNSHPALAREISEILDVPLTQREIVKFENDNIFIKINETVRDHDVFVIQTSTDPVNYHLMELLLMIDTLRYSSAGRITAVMPYFPYVRSDKKDQPRISIGARLVANLLETAGADRVITLNLHSWQIQGFFRIPADHVLADSIIIDHFRKRDLSNTVAVAPDAGGAKRVEKYAHMLRLPFVIMDKRRRANDDSSQVRNIIGDARGKNAIIFDDEISTGGSILETVRMLKAHGAERIFAAVVHGVLCGDAVARLNACPDISEVITTNSAATPDKAGAKVNILSCAAVLAKAIQHIHSGDPLSPIFSDFYNNGG